VLRFMVSAAVVPEPLLLLWLDELELALRLIEQRQAWQPNRVGP
jgi:hypothetical protein